MACGTAVVATDSGDAAAIVGSTGRVVPTRDPAALASAILELLAENGRDRAGISARARARVAEAYSVEALVLRTTRVLERVRVIA
jgi:glycosyltransferase involved in cell wall biosynthesis